MNPHQVTKDFERALCEYTGAPFAVAVNSCTMAILLALAWNLRSARAVRPVESIDGRHVLLGGYWPQERIIEIPKRTYISVPMSIIHAGGRPTFREEEWEGAYALRPLPVWDAARWFTSGMYQEIQRWEDWKLAHHKSGPMLCVSFHASKTLGIEQGGAILHDDPEADAWLRRARFDGRTEGVVPKDDAFRQVGWHCYMNPSTAAQGILRLHSLPKHNEPLPNDLYPDLSTMEIFK